MNKEFWKAAARVAIVVAVVGFFIHLMMNADPVVSSHELNMGAKEMLQEIREMREELREINEDIQDLKEKQDQINELIEQYANGKLKYA